MEIPLSIDFVAFLFPWDLYYVHFSKFTVYPPFHLWVACVVDGQCESKHVKNKNLKRSAPPFHPTIFICINVTTFKLNLTNNPVKCF